MEAIARRLCVDATYNRGAVRLAPYSIFERHGGLYVEAVTVERAGRSPREVRLGTFRLSGLARPQLSEVGFEPVALPSPNAGRLDRSVIFAV